MFLVEQYYSYQKVSTLQKQVPVIARLSQEQKDFIGFNIIQFNADIANINKDIQSLLRQTQYDYLALYLFQTTPDYLNDLNTLKTLIKKFDRICRVNFSEYQNEEPYTQKLLLEPTAQSIFTFINSMLIKNISYDKKRFDSFSKVFISMFILLLLITFWYKSKLSLVYRDIALLSSIDKDGSQETVTYKTKDIEFISQRTSRKSQIAQSPEMMDPITEIYNNKGMVQAYSQRKGLKDNSFSSVAILEIDNFSKSKRTYSQEFTQKILKKVAYAISLHQQATDIIARSDYNQFTLIFSRPSKEQLFKHTELVRESIAEIKLLGPDKEAIIVTVTGGFIHKVSASPLNESIKKAKELLTTGKTLGKNRIIQQKDLPKNI